MEAKDIHTPKMNAGNVDNKRLSARTRITYIIMVISRKANVAPLFLNFRLTHRVVALLFSYV